MIFYENPPVITGIGVATSIGTRKVTFLNSLEKGRSGLRFIEKFDLQKSPVKKAFEVTDSIHFNDPKLDPSINFALHATKESLDDSGLEKQAIQSKNIMTIVSSSKGGMTTFEKIHQKETELEQFFLQVPTHIASLEVQKAFGLKGSAQNVVTACATGLQSILMASMFVGKGEFDFAVAGAADASITPLMLSGYHRLKAYSHSNMYPFDVRRNGFIIGEGAGIVTLEREEDALKRNAHLYAKIRGFMLAQDCGTSVLNNAKENTLAEAIKRLLKSAELDPRDIDLISLHGTSTKLGDLYEAGQLKMVFRDHLPKVKCHAPKAQVGHMLGAAGAVETITTALSLDQKTYFPTINSTQPDPHTRLDLNVNRISKNQPIRRALKISMGFGGHIAVILLER